MPALKDLTGRVFGKLTVIKRVENSKMEGDSRAQYLCQCDCGKQAKVVARYLWRRDRTACFTCKPKSNYGDRKSYWGKNADMLTKRKELNE